MIEIGRFGIWDFENVFGKEITSNGPILDSWWQVHVHTNRKIRFTFRISNLLSVKTLLSVSFLSGFSGKSCQVSVCCPNSVRIYCPVSVCPDLSVSSPSAVRIMSRFSEKWCPLCLFGRTRTRQLWAVGTFGALVHWPLPQMTSDDLK